jgi:fermentation-respiration switch protein FrsA (DUF1100 family)
MTPLDGGLATVMTPVQFNRDDLALAGNLFTPPGFNEDEQYAAVIVQGSLTSVKEQMPRTYAEKFAAQGFVALAPVFHGDVDDGIAA